MRVLGLALVTASLLLGTGGVIYRPALAQESRARVADPEPEMCRADSTPLGVELGARRARIAVPAGGGSVVSLGTRGFNYSRPGDPIPTPVRSVAGAPPAAAD
jgi:hypothetical protein